MGLENYKHEELSLKDLEMVIEKIEDPTNSLHKFINTSIYSSFKYNLQKRQEALQSD